MPGSELAEGAGVLLVRHVLVALAGEDGVEEDADDRGDRETGQGDVDVADGEGDRAGVGEVHTQRQAEDDGRDDDVAGLLEVGVVLDHVADADCGA